MSPGHQCEMSYLLDSFVVLELSTDYCDFSATVYCPSCCAPAAVAIDEYRVALHAESRSNFDGVGRERSERLDSPDPFQKSIHAAIFLPNSHRMQIILLRQAFLRKRHIFTN